jgi:hypothetical protein
VSRSTAAADIRWRAAFAREGEPAAAPAGPGTDRCVGKAKVAKSIGWVTPRALPRSAPTNCPL